MFFKWLFAFLKPVIANLVAELQANRAVNIQTIENTVGGGTTTVEAAVVGFLANEAKKNATIGIFVQLAEPELIGVISGLVQKGVTTVPELYDAGVAFLIHEEAVV